MPARKSKAIEDSGPKLSDGSAVDGLAYSELLSQWLRVGEIYQKCQRVLQRDLRAIDLSVAQHDVLVAVKNNPALTQRELADTLYVVKSNVTSLVRKLEQRQLLLRTPDPQDGRVIRLNLTSAGVGLVQQSLRIQRRVVAAMMGPISRPELVTLERVIQNASAALDQLD